MNCHAPPSSHFRQLQGGKEGRNAHVSKPGILLRLLVRRAVRRQLCLKFCSRVVIQEQASFITRRLLALHLPFSFKRDALKLHSDSGTGFQISALDHLSPYSRFLSPPSIHVPLPPACTLTARRRPRDHQTRLILEPRFNKSTDAGLRCEIERLFWKQGLCCGQASGVYLRLCSRNPHLHSPGFQWRGRMESQI